MTAGSRPAGIRREVAQTMPARYLDTAATNEAT